MTSFPIPTQRDRTMTTEKRAYKRFVFSKGTEVKATLIMAGGHGTVEAKILNISKGGLGLAARKIERDKFGEESEMSLLGISGGDGLICLKGQKVKIKWVLNYEPLENLGIGCEFVNLNSDCIEEIDYLLGEGSA